MKKKILGSIVILAVAMVAIGNMNVNSKGDSLSDISMENVEALAKDKLKIESEECPNGCYCNGWWACEREA